MHLVNLFLGEPNRLIGTGSRGETGVDVHAAATLAYDATDRRPAATASVVCSLVTDLPTRLEIFCAGGSLRYDNMIVPAEFELTRRGAEEPERFVTQWPGGGYTFQVQEVMRCLRSGEVETPLVPWADTLAVARTLDHWQATFLPERPREIRWPPSAGVAQLAAHLSCKQVVGGSSPPASSASQSSFYLMRADLRLL